MSKVPSHGLWARATTSAAATSSSGRAVSALAKPRALRARQGQHAQAITPSQGSSTSSASSTLSADISNTEASRLAALGGVSAPYHGPQPAEVVAYEQAAQQQSSSLETALITTSLQSLATTFGTLHASTMSASSTRHMASLAARHYLTSANALNLVTPYPNKPPQMWSHSYRTSAPSASSAGGPSVQDSEATAQSRFAIPPTAMTRRPLKARKSLQYKGKAAQKTSAVMDAEMEQVEEFFTSLWLSATAANARLDAPAKHYSTLGSRSPSPKGARPGAEVGPRGLHQGVREPPQKFAVTTSAESSLSSSTSAGEGNNGAETIGNALAVCNTVSLSAESSSSGSALPRDLNGTDHWARYFNIPRSYKRHDFMFEHGAYGIPKRHPLSSIRKASLPSASGNNDATEGRTPRRDQVPATRVQAAQDMLAAAADFLAGSQRGASGDLYCPTNGQDALRAAFSGGSTADGRELRGDGFSGSRSGAKRRNGSSPHRMTIRGTDGRIIKDRLRSVQVGEDAYFLRPDSLGVADGVGGWASRPGADPALFSRLLMHFCAVELSRYDGVSASDLAADEGSMLKAWASVNPVEVMHRAWERCVRASRREGILGSSTALIALLRGDELRIANMGDCVLMIVRGGEMIFRSTEQQHSFNFPVQLGMMGDTTESLKKHASGGKAAAEGEISSAAAGTEPLEDYDDVEDDLHGDASGNHDLNALPPGVSNGETQEADSGKEDTDPAWDEPRRDAGRWTVRVEAGDIIVVGSDGLMDNLFDEDIMEEVIRFLPRSSNGQPDQDLLRSIDGGRDGSGGGLSLSGSGSSGSSRFSPQLVSEALCSRAKAVSEDSRAISSPFQQRAMEEGLNYVGGKHDDISVLVCLVGERDLLDAEQPPAPLDGATADATSQTQVTA